jgi:hypothetical protein
VAGLSLAYTGNVTLGNLLIVAAGSRDAGGGVTFAVSDTQGNIYSSLALVDANSISGGRGQIFVVTANATGANTVNLATGSATPQLLIHEFSGVTSIDVFTSAIGSGQSQDSGPVSTRVAAELLFGFVLLASAQLALTQGAGWTLAETLGVDVLTEWQIVAAKGTFNATSTSTAISKGTSLWLAEIATFNAAQASSGDYWIGGRQHETKIILPGYANAALTPDGKPFPIQSSPW